MDKKYLSLDIEATGLEENCYLIQLAVIPLNVTKRTVETKLAHEIYIQCPSFESLKPNLNEWVLKHNEFLIREAHAKGMSQDSFKEWFANYLESEEVEAYFEKEKPIILGKSLSALDIPLLTRYLGKSFMEAYFHHHTLDVTCVARALVDAGKLPEGCGSTSKLIKHLGIREDAKHTALSDATDMAHIYFKILELLE